MDKRELQDIIEDYVQGILSNDDRTTFEGWLQKDPTLQTEVDAVRLALVGRERIQQEEMLKQFQAWDTETLVQDRPSSNTPLWISLGIIALITAIAYFFLQRKATPKVQPKQEKIETGNPAPPPINEATPTTIQANPPQKTVEKPQNKPTKQAPKEKTWENRPIAMNISPKQNHVLRDEIPLNNASVVRGSKPDKNKYPVWTSLETARELLLKGEAAAAQNILIDIPANDIYWAKAQMLLGHLYLGKNQCDKALESFKNASIRDSKDKQIRYSLWVGFTSCGLENSAAAEQIKEEIINDKRNPYREMVND